MKITLEVNGLDYGALIAALLPLVHSKLEQEEDSVVNKILLKLTALPPSIARRMVNLLPRDTQDEIVVLLINKNSAKIADLAVNMAKEKDIFLQIDKLEAEVQEPVK